MYAALCAHLAVGMAKTKAHYAWIGPSNGYAAIFWDAKSPGYYDWVGIYDAQQKGQNDYLTYQWATKGSSYVTGEYINSGLSVRYFTWTTADAVSSTNTSFKTEQKGLDLNEIDSEGKCKWTPSSVLSVMMTTYLAHGNGQKVIPLMTQAKHLLLESMQDTLSREVRTLP